MSLSALSPLSMRSRALIQRNTSDFYAPLTHTLALSNGTGSPTLTRATAMWVFDNEDKLVNVPASAAAFGGARRVRNMLTSPDVLATQGVTTLAATYTISFYGTGSVAFSGTYAGASLVGTGVSDRVQRTFTATAGTLTLTVTGSVTTAQLENVTGQTDQTASEYVVGDNGAGVTNLQYFTTHKDGTPIPPSSLLGLATNHAAVTNTMLYCRDFTNPVWVSSLSGAELVVNGDGSSISGWTANNSTLSVSGGLLKVTNVAGGIATGWQSFTTIVGKRYRLSGNLVNTNGGSCVLQARKDSEAGTLYSNLIAASPSSLTGTFIAESTTTVVRLVSGATFLAGQAAEWDNVTCKQNDVQPTLTGTGLDKAANSCSLLTFTADNATILQTISAASSAGCTGFYVKRSAGTGTISITRDGGTSWTDITSLINSSTFTKVKIENTSVTNPSVGFKISTSGDAIIVDGGINHLGTKIHYLPILTTSAAVTVGAQTLTYPKAGNIIDADGTVMATVTMDDWTGVDGGVVGSTTHGLFATSTGASAKDGTNTPTGAADTPSGTVDIGMKYTTDFMRTMSDAGFGTATDYTGTLATDLTNISIGSGVTGYVKEVAIWQEVISDYKMRNMP